MCSKIRVQASSEMICTLEESCLTYIFMHKILCQALHIFMAKPISVRHISSFKTYP